MTETEILADVIAEVVKAATAPLLAKCAVLETQVAALEARAPVPGPPGPQGEPGARGEAGPSGQDGAAGPQGEPGRDGINGKDAPPVDLDEIARRAAVLVPAGKDGAPGRDGLPGIPGRDGAQGERGEKGLDGKDGAPGRDGTLDELRVEQVDDRRWRFVRSDGTPMPGDPIYMSVTVYKGVFVDGTAYDKGDAVTSGGSLWIARETTKNRPGEGSTAWQLAAKEGRRGHDGKPGKDGERGPKGERGDPGRNFG